ncbi:phospholipid-binding protein MlaC [Azonexus sp. R2A61]|uniref:MlaC/ttg2D family ABC transporter substrate-binding protein n=1 Tax=Azonexus sp. R2A61 TaxID=2744443 RepID=UPI001F32D6DF|nr:ABC transporter substrate-binding protein [Azonexus sp. R2A61]
MKKLFALLFAGCLALSAIAQEAPDAMVKRVSEEVLETIRKDKEIQGGNTQKVIALANSKVLPYFDFSRMTALAVGKDWRRADADQKKRLADEFRNLLVRTYANALSSYSNQKIVFKPFRMNPGDSEVLVRTEVIQPGAKPVQIDYNLELQDGAWKVFDVVVAGISLVTNYREQFAQEVRAGGIDGLIASIAAKNKSLDAGQGKSSAK